MSSLSKRRAQHNKRHRIEQGLPSRVELPPAPCPQSTVQQQSPSGQQQQWLSTIAGGTPNFVSQDNLTQHPNAPQSQWNASSAIQTTSPGSVAVHAVMTPTAYPFQDYGINSATMTTTTTTTTLLASHQCDLHGYQNSIQPLTQVASQVQNMQIRQPNAKQQIEAAQFQRHGAPVEMITSTPPSDQLGSPQYPSSHNSPLSQQKASPEALNQDSRYPVTVEQRQTAFSQWRVQNSSKPQRTLDRTMQEYLSGKKDKMIYEMLINQQQALQISNSLQTQHISKEGERHQQKVAREQERRDRQQQRIASQQRSQQVQNTLKAEQSAKAVERQEQKAIRDQQRRNRQNEREERERQRRNAELEESQRQIMLRQFEQPGLMTPGILGGFSGLVGSGNAVSTATQSVTTIEVVNMITQQGTTPTSGEHRKKAIAEGEDAVRRLDELVQSKLAVSGLCPAMFHWIPLPDGYLCEAGGHFLPDQEIDMMLRSSWYRPQVQPVNENGISLVLGLPTGLAPLKKPPEQLPRWSRCWKRYEQARRFHGL